MRRARLRFVVHNLLLGSDGAFPRHFHFLLIPRQPQFMKIYFASFLHIYSSREAKVPIRLLHEVVQKHLIPLTKNGSPGNASPYRQTTPAFINVLSVDPTLGGFLSPVLLATEIDEKIILEHLLGESFSY